MTATAHPHRTRRPMTLWRLEVARLARTHRWLIVFGVFATFGVLGPVGARYLNEIVERFGEGMTVAAAEPRPVDGIAQFVSNIAQIGLLAVVVVAAGALTIDAKPELAAFLRTKLAKPGWLVVPPYLVTTAATAAALIFGTGVAWLLTHSLIGPLPAGAMVVGTMFGILFMAFAVAVVALVAGYTRGQATTVFGALAALLALPLIGLIDPIQPWLPSALATAVAAMVDGAPASDYTRSVLVTVIVIPAMLAWAARRVSRREL